MNPGEPSNASETVNTVALIGSFRRHYHEVLSAAQVFTQGKLTVTSPKCSQLISGGLFVRFETDNPELSDVAIQSVTLRNIFTASLVYVVNPSGYVGRTTCYEIGRIMQRRQPIYFLSPPSDLPVEIPHWAICTPDILVKCLESERKPRWLYDGTPGLIADIERLL